MLYYISLSLPLSADTLFLRNLHTLENFLKFFNPFTVAPPTLSLSLSFFLSPAFLATRLNFTISTSATGWESAMPSAPPTCVESSAFSEPGEVSNARLARRASRPSLDTCKNMIY